MRSASDRTPTVSLDDFRTKTPARQPGVEAHPARLYIAVIVAVALGIAMGFAGPDFAAELRPLGTAFVNLIKMMISPVIFCTIVLGIGSIRGASKVGRVGGLALGYFLTMSTVALIIGLVVGNLLQPGEGLGLTPEGTEAAKAAASEEKLGTVDFLLNIIPTTLVSRWSAIRSCRRCSSPCSSASRCRRWVRRGRLRCAVSSTSSGWCSVCWP